MQASSATIPRPSPGMSLEAEHQLMALVLLSQVHPHGAGVDWTVISSKLIEKGLVEQGFTAKRCEYVYSSKNAASSVVLQLYACY